MGEGSPFPAGFPRHHIAVIMMGIMMGPRTCLEIGALQCSEVDTIGPIADIWNNTDDDVEGASHLDISSTTTRCRLGRV